MVRTLFYWTRYVGNGIVNFHALSVLMVAGTSLGLCHDHELGTFYCLVLIFHWLDLQNGNSQDRRIQVVSPMPTVFSRYGLW